MTTFCSFSPTFAACKIPEYPALFQSMFQYPILPTISATLPGSCYPKQEPTSISHKYQH